MTGTGDSGDSGAPGFPDSSGIPDYSSGFPADPVAPIGSGGRFRRALEEEKPLQIIGTVNAYAAMMAQRVGYRAIYLSGAGVANYSFGLPDLGMTSLEDVLADVRRITSATALPLLVDIDTGWGGAFNIARTIKQMIAAGAAAVHIEDQIAQKRCGHRPNKAIVSTGEMADRVKAAADAKTDPDFVLVARTDALQSEGLSGVIDRACAYVEAGADAIFAEAMTDLEMYGKICAAVKAPVLANLTEFGATPYFSRDQLRGQGVAMLLYPLSATRAMQRAALEVMRAIRREGSQERVLGLMQTRAELYDFLGYEAYEKTLDRLFGHGGAR